MNNIFKNFLLVIISILITFILTELFLRLLGFQPVKYIKSNSPNPSIYKHDKNLGWSNKEGIYLSKIDEDNIITYTFLEDGSRYSGKDFNKYSEEKKIILIGGSLTLGQAINDDETFSFHLQKYFTHYEIKNFGVAGYGTYQSYLKLKYLFQNIENIEYVIYSFMDHHEIRNTGDASWLEFLTGLSREPVYIPYVKLDKNSNLIEYAPIKYVKLPLSKYSVLITKLQKQIMRLFFFKQNEDISLITKKLLIKMHKLSNKNDSKFIIVNLISDKLKMAEYNNFAKANIIQFKDCQIELNDKFRVKNDGHPNHLANKKYANCIQQFIK